MDAPRCPECGSKANKGYFCAGFECETCGACLASNLRAVAFVEVVLGWPFVILVVVALGRWPAFQNWSYLELVLLMFFPACIVHFLVIQRFVRLRKLG